MEKKLEYLDEVTIRFAGDSGDGMQLTGTQFSDTSASLGNDVNTFPDYPSEIRAPEGTLYGVSAYQIHLGAKNVNTPGDKIDVLVAMNASSLKVNLPHLKEHGIIICNKAGFKDKNLKLAKYDVSPLEDGSLSKYQVFAYNISELVKNELEGMDIPPKSVEKTKNMFALGLTYWLYNKPIEPTEKWLNKKFGKKPEILDANLKVLRAGWAFGATRQELAIRYVVRQADLKPGIYRNITGNNAVALGLVTAAKKANLPLFLGSYPITPATEILHFLSGYKAHGVKTFQAEDEIAGITSAIGASFGGALAATTTSGPGLSLKVEAMGLAVILELPLVIVNVMRAGPSTGLPTKPEQSDLNLAVYGRHGEGPLPVVAARSSRHCFEMTIEAARIALKYMTPVILLTDGYIAQGSEAWKIPNVAELPDIPVEFATDPDNFHPYLRDEVTLARPWAVPGTEGLEHRIGGLEKSDVDGLVSHDPENHQKMVEFRAKKVAGVANDIPDLEVDGDKEGELLILGWGSSYGAIKSAITELRDEGINVSHAHLNYINPFPKNLGEILYNFKRILIPELNLGQLRDLIKTKYMLAAEGFNKIQGNPFTAYEIKNKIKEMLEEGK